MRTETEPTRAGVERFLVHGYVLVRAFDVIQISIALSIVLSRGLHAPAHAALAFLVFVETLFICRRLLRRGIYNESRAVALDVSTGCAAVLITGLLTSPSAGLASWSHWAWPLTPLIAAGVGIALPRWRERIAVTSVLVVAYLISTSHIVAERPGELMTALTNAFAIPGFMVLMAVLAGFLRRLGNEADEQRSVAAATAAELERVRAGKVIHDHVSVLRAVGTTDATPLLQEAALRGARQAERFLSGESVALTSFATGLREIVDCYPDLPVVLSTDNCLRSPSGDVIAGVCAAVGTCLANVREHSGASSVTVRLVDDGEQWTLTVRDDGVGFDPADVTAGFGTREILTSAEALGVLITTTSSAGNGTVVHMSGAWT